MSMFSQTAIGAGALVLALNATLAVVLPSPPAISVHDLSYGDGMVTQDRTIRGTGDAFKIGWSATVINPTTDEPVPFCSGEGSFPYPIGRRAARMDLPTWTGRAECTPDSLSPGEYVLRATWSWGDQQTTATSEPFRIE
jgi:hypothetical protein